MSLGTEVPRQRSDNPPRPPPARRPCHAIHPQLRYNAATELRKEFSIETARIILGHHSAAITEVYDERDEREAIKAIMKVG
jgi:hypothetical protein